MNIYTWILIVLILLGTASCVTDHGRSYQYSPYSGYPADYWNSRPDYTMPLPFHGPAPR